MKILAILMKMKMIKDNYLRNQIYLLKIQILIIKFSMAILELNSTIRECSHMDVPVTKKLS